jgi:3-methyladenine DNA glycosylase AlkD
MMRTAIQASTVYAEPQGPAGARPNLPATGQGPGRGDENETAGSPGGARATRDPGGAASAASGSAAHAVRVLASRRKRAADLGRRLGADLSDPDALAQALGAALGKLADPEYRAGQAIVAPGIGPTYGVRTPLQVTLRRAFERATRRASSAELLFVAQRLLREPERESRWFAIATLERTLRVEPERTWQLLRRAAQESDDWITVDTLARPYAQGVLAERYRWAELEQLTVSPSRWERRLVGSTIATIPFVDRHAGREPEVASAALPILATLMGDHEPDVQKSLAWAYRSMLLVDATATTVALVHQAEIATERGDGHRAWVIRDTLSKLDPEVASELRVRLAGLRRTASAPSTSDAAELAARFAGMGLGRNLPEPPL